MLNNWAAQGSGGQQSVITCSRLFLGSWHRAQYAPTALPLCIQLDQLDVGTMGMKAR